MTPSSVKMIFQSDIQKVWDVVLAVENYTWRSDLSKVKVINEKQFIVLKPFVKTYLKKQQKQFVMDLQKVL